jgi:FlaA1/EpsC-like NDP-sugar epimerase
MELFLIQKSSSIQISTARFANVAFSDGSLLYSFRKRIEKNQPIAGPDDIKRYFVIAQESGELCLMSCLFGSNRDIFFPKLAESLDLINIKEIAIKFLESIGKTPLICESEEEARVKMNSCSIEEWPCYFSESDTTGEKSFEEFYTENEILDFDTYKDIGVIKSNFNVDFENLNTFIHSIGKLRNSGYWSKSDIVQLFQTLLPDFMLNEKGKYLDSKM